MFYHAASNQYFQNGAFILDGTSYPYGWLNATSTEEKIAIGLVEVTIVGQREDDRFYWVNESLADGVLTYTNTPKDLDALKAQWVKQVNQIAYNLLLPSDWMVVKALETSSVVPAAWTAYRAAVRSTASDAVAAINACADVPALQTAVQVTWPNDPDYVVV